MAITASQPIARVLDVLHALADPSVVASMEHFAIRPTTIRLGVSIPKLRGLARQLGHDHALAEALWQSGMHEAQILAALVDEPTLVTEEQMERWAVGFDSWNICDACCQDLFRKTPYAGQKVREWSARPEQFVKRAAFALIAEIARHDKTSDDAVYLAYLPIIEREADDDRNFVKKAVNWALREIGKRNPNLRDAAISTGLRLREHQSASARWTANNALRELRRDTDTRSRRTASTRDS
ncbi:MAG TPA: DNA alkylation repair protein [Chloroflexota bacterium]|nr:DNA alkylation repair protein [Chloroflexota bacterium]